MSDWQVARLIPTWGINSDTEAEARATSATLAVLTVVREFSSALLTPLGASSARRAVVESFIETSFKTNDGSIVRPDGLIRVSYGKNVWTALVEVKTSNNQLRPEQVNTYWEVARDYGFDAVITISNEFAVNDKHPTDGLRVRSNSKVAVHHYSWTKILTTAVMCKVHRGVEDPEQAWILGELIRYLESSSSGVTQFNDMGPNWVSVRDGAKNSNLSRSSDEVIDIAQRWDQLVRFAALQLSSEIGVDVQQVLSKSEQDLRIRTAGLVDELCAEGTLNGELRIPNTAGNIEIKCDIRARQLVVAIPMATPTDRGNKARQTWLLKQLKSEVPNNLVVEAWPRNIRTPVTATLQQLRDQEVLLDDPNGRDIMRYRLVLRSEMGLSRKSGGKSPGFVESVTRLLDRFYGDIVQGLVPWVPRAPVRKQRKPVDVERPSEIVDSRSDAEDAIDSAVQTARTEVGVIPPIRFLNESTNKPSPAERTDVPQSSLDDQRRNQLI